MATIFGLVEYQGLPVNGATCKLYASTSFVSAPQKGTALPASGILQTVTSATSLGCDGAYRFLNVAPGRYYVGVSHAGSVVWDSHDVQGEATVNVMDYGAKGDAATDDSAAIQAAITALPLAGGRVYFPAGTYVLNSTLTFARDNVHLIGEGYNTTKLRCPAAAIGIDVGDGVTIYHYVTLRDLTLTRTSPGGATSVRWRKVDQGRIVRCAITGGTTNLDLDGCIACVVESCGINTFTEVGVRLQNTDQICIANNTWETNVGSTPIHIRVDSGNKAVAITGNSFSTADWAVLCQGGASTDCLITGNCGENLENGLSLGPNTPAAARWVVSGNVFRGTAVALTRGLITWGTNIVVVGNSFTNFSGTVIEEPSGFAAGANIIACNDTDGVIVVNAASSTVFGNRGTDFILGEGENIAVGTSTGTKIGTATNEKIGFWNATPVVRPSAYTPTNVTPDRSYDANATTTDELADVLGTLISDLQSVGLIG